MSVTTLPFASLGWKAGAHPLERKKQIDGQPAVLLQFEPGFEDPNWCEHGHVIHVLTGTFELVTEGRTAKLDAGDACVVERGTRHRARNGGDVPVRLFVVSS